MRTWRQHALEEFSARMRDENFPCLFGRKAWMRGTTRCLFAECGPARDYDAVLVGLIDYTEFVRKTALTERILSPLVIFIDTSDTGTVTPHEIGWDILNRMHALDPAPWPEAIPSSPDDPAWCFCFNGVQLFVNMSAPGHMTLRSRNLGRHLTLVINPRENFDAVASVHTRSGQLIRKRIRDRVAVYNRGAVPEELGFYGDAENREWLQYQLSEPGLARPATCPFRSRHDVATPDDEPRTAVQADAELESIHD